MEQSIFIDLAYGITILMLAGLVLSSLFRARRVRRLSPQDPDEA
jgi:heme exporter protein CcmD